jgi:mono/diheme cytochrome c family protein
MISGSICWGQRNIPDDYERGRSLFNGSCRQCHLDRSQGDQPTAYYLRFRPDDFNDEDFWKKHNEKTIAETISRGKGAMPAQRVSAEETRLIIDYMVKKFKK